MIWSMRQQTALRLCNHLRAHANHCEVVPPATFTQLASLKKKELAEQAAKRAKRAKRRKKKRRRRKRVDR